MRKIQHNDDFEFLLVKNELVENISKLHKLKLDKTLNEDQRRLVEVSLLDKVKYGLSKLGRYKAGGKIFGKGKIDQEAAAKIQQIIDKKGNELIKTLHDGIQVINKKGKGEFPNNQDPDIFLDIILTISAVYDNIVAATKLQPDEQGFLPIDIANNIISDLREYVKKYLDVDLTVPYSIMDSEEEETEDVIIEDRESDVRDQLKSKKGEDAEEISSERMKTLKSWRLPLALMGAGASFGALSWLIEWMFPAEKITTWTPEVVQKYTEEVIGHVKPGDGFTQTLNSIKSLGVKLTPNSSPEEVVQALAKLGGGDAQKGVEIITQSDSLGEFFTKPSEARSTLMELVNDPHKHGDTLRDVFDKTSSRAGTGKLPYDTLETHSGGELKMMVVKSFIKWTTKTVIKKTAMAVVAAPVLKVLGLGLLGAGVLVKLFREKGKGQSRAATLNELLQSLQFVKGETLLDTTPTQDSEETTTGEVPQDGDNRIKSDEFQDYIGNDTGDSESNTEGGVGQVPDEFLNGNRNTQLAYLASNFLPEGQDFWSRLGIKKGTNIPGGFLDAALGQGKNDPEKYLKAYHKHLLDKNLLTKKLNVGSWLSVVRSKKNLALIKWVRNTRKNVGSLTGALAKAYKQFEIGQRKKAKVSKPGKEGEAMGIAGESLNGRFDLITEINMGPSSFEAGFDEDLFMKNLPQFMEMLSMMYYGTNGSKLYYNKEAVLQTCKKYGCKPGGNIKLQQTKSDDYNFVENHERLSEEINRIKKLMM